MSNTDSILNFTLTEKATLYLFATAAVYGIIWLSDSFQPPYMSPLETLTLTLTVVIGCTVAIRFGGSR